jgi:hypothetical protein
MDGLYCVILIEDQGEEGFLLCGDDVEAYHEVTISDRQTNSDIPYKAVLPLCKMHLEAGALEMLMARAG